MIEVVDQEEEFVLEVVDGATFSANLVAGLEKRWLCEGGWRDVDFIVDRDEGVSIDAVTKLRG